LSKKEAETSVAKDFTSAGETSYRVAQISTKNDDTNLEMARKWQNENVVAMVCEVVRK
jgi:2-keto-4-pentenoate hydratase